MKLKFSKKFIYRIYDDCVYLESYVLNKDFFFDVCTANFWDKIASCIIDSTSVPSFFACNISKVNSNSIYVDFLSFLITNEIIDVEFASENEKIYFLTRENTDANCFIKKTSIRPEVYNGTIILNENCNNRCLHCYNHFNDRKSLFMADYVFDCSLNNLAQAGSVVISISGGEALLHPQITDFLSRINNHGFRLRLYSNAQLINDNFCKKIKEYNISPFSITLYSLHPEIHDAITQNKGSWEGTINGLKLLRKYSIPFIISTPILNLNCKEIDKLSDFCINELGALSFGPNPFISYTTNHKKSNSTVICNAEQTMKFSESYFKCFPATTFFHTNKTEESPLMEEDFYSSITIHPNGDITPGTLLPDVILGNVCRDSINEIWNNSKILKQMRTIRIKDIKNCNFKSCPVSKFCEPSIADNWVANNDFCVADEHYCELMRAYYNPLVKKEF